mgnify:CR=1 FL=1
MAAAAAGGTACDFLYFLKFALDVGKAVRLRKCAVNIRERDVLAVAKLCGVTVEDIFSYEEDGEHEKQGEK